MTNYDNNKFSFDLENYALPQNEKNLDISKRSNLTLNQDDPAFFETRSDSFHRFDNVSNGSLVRPIQNTENFKNIYLDTLEENHEDEINEIWSLTELVNQCEAGYDEEKISLALDKESDADAFSDSLGSIHSSGINEKNKAINELKLFHGGNNINVNQSYDEYEDSVDDETPCNKYEEIKEKSILGGMKEERKQTNLTKVYTGHFMGKPKSEFSNGTKTNHDQLVQKENKNEFYTKTVTSKLIHSDYENDKLKFGISNTNSDYIQFNDLIEPHVKNNPISYDENIIKIDSVHSSITLSLTNEEISIKYNDYCAILIQKFIRGYLARQKYAHSIYRRIYLRNLRKALLIGWKTRRVFYCSKSELIKLDIQRIMKCKSKELNSILKIYIEKFVTLIHILYTTGEWIKTHKKYKSKIEAPLLNTKIKNNIQKIGRKNGKISIKQIYN